MIIGEAPKKVFADNYANDPMHAFAESFVQLTENIMQESVTDLYESPRSALIKTNSREALKQFFVENSYDPDGMTPDEINDHIATMEQQFENDREGILESTMGASINPMIGMTFPLHKFILMNMVFDKGAIPKFVTRSPKFTISMEYRILVDTEGNEIDMFRDQNLMTAAIEKTAAAKEFELPTLPFTEDNEIVHIRNTCDAFDGDVTISPLSDPTKLSVTWTLGDHSTTLDADFATKAFRITEKQGSEETLVYQQD